MSFGQKVIKAKRFVVGILSILILIHGGVSVVASQVVFQALYPRNSVQLQHKYNLTKKAFISLLISILAFVAPSSVRITTDNATIAKGTFYKTHGKIASHLKRRSIIIANHQIYTDWVFLWWLTSTADLAGNIFIILKKSLESLPIFGYGMKNFRFIFVSRKWAQDKITLHNGLGTIDANSRGVGPLAGQSPLRVDPNGEIFWDTNIFDESKVCWPYSLILFPEGTNLSSKTRQKSAAFAEKISRQPFENVLLPHITGLRFALLALRPSLEVVYDVTIGYSGVKKEEYGELIYRLPNIFLKGKSPKLVDMHIRAFNVADIPMDDEDEFMDWLYKVWKEKDDLMETYYSKGSFDLDPELDQTIVGGFKISPVHFLITSFLPTSIFFAILILLYLLFFFKKG